VDRMVYGLVAHQWSLESHLRERAGNARAGTYCAGIPPQDILVETHLSVVLVQILLRTGSASDGLLRR
jgi:hypothetical protein